MSRFFCPSGNLETCESHVMVIGRTSRESTESTGLLLEGANCCMLNIGKKT